ncbi:flagellar basal body rod protein FlgF [Vibrio harveyi]|nr:flagellar basal body rod protein FlgF [Vibrio harveyi]
MDKLLFTAASGATRVLFAQQVQANNLANINTDGFRADIEQAESIDVLGPGFQTRTMVSATNGGTDFSLGNLKYTANPLDIAIRGDGFIAVQAHENDEAYTRSGSLHLSANGELMQGEHYVLGEGGPIVIPEHKSINVGGDGTISIVPVGGNAVQEVARIKLVKPETSQLQKSQDGLFRLKTGGEADLNESVNIASEYIESSNVNAIEALVNNITLSRNFEFQVKMMKVADQLATTGNKLIRGS